MGTWWTAIKDSDTFADIYDKFYELYNKGEQPGTISKKIIEDNWEILKFEERNNFWFAIALAQWETKSLDARILSTIEEIITSGADFKNWLDFGASEQDIRERKAVLNQFLKKIKSNKLKAKSRNNLNQ